MGREFFGGVFLSCKGHGDKSSFKNLSPQGGLLGEVFWCRATITNGLCMVCAVSRATHVGEACAVFPAP